MLADLMIGEMFDPLSDEKKLNWILYGKEYSNVRELKQEYNQLEYQLQYGDCFRLWDLAETKYHWGVVCCLLAITMKEKKFLKSALDAFNFVLKTEHYRHARCTNKMLECLISACENA